MLKLVFEEIPHVEVREDTPLVEGFQRKVFKL